MKYELVYAPKAVREFRKLPPDLQDEVIATLEALRVKTNHSRLKVHKLSGKWKDFYAASVNYSHRVIFYFKRDDLCIVSIGSHDIYDKA